MLIILCTATLFPLIYTPWLDDYYYFPKFILLFVLVLGAVAHLFLKRHLIEWHRLKHLPGKWWLLGFILFLSLSTLLSPYKIQAYVGEYSRHTGLLFYLFTYFLFVYSYLIMTKDKLDILLKAFVFIAIPISIYGIFQYYGIWPHFYESQRLFYGRRSSSTIGNPNFFGTYLYLMFVLGCFLFFKYNRWVYLLGPLVIFACLLTTETRSAWLASFIIFIVISVINWRKKAFWLLCGSLAVVSILIVSTSHQITHRMSSTVQSTVNDVQTNNTGSLGSARGIIWENSLRTLGHSSVETLLIGTGPDTFDKRVYFSPNQKQKYYHTKAIDIDKAHNIFLETLLTLGIPAFICLYMFYFSLLTFTKNKSVLFYLSLLLVGYFIQGFFNIDVVSVYPMFLILLSVLDYYKSRHSYKTSEKRTRP